MDGALLLVVGRHLFEPRRPRPVTAAVRDRRQEPKYQKDADPHWYLADVEMSVRVQNQHWYARKHDRGASSIRKRTIHQYVWQGEQPNHTKCGYDATDNAYAPDMRVLWHDGLRVKEITAAPHLCWRR